eukprot:g5254.t1
MKEEGKGNEKASVDVNVPTVENDEEAAKDLYGTNEGAIDKQKHELNVAQNKFCASLVSASLRYSTAFDKINRGDYLEKLEELIPLHGEEIDRSLNELHEIFQQESIDRNDLLSIRENLILLKAVHEERIENLNMDFDGSEPPRHFDAQKRRIRIRKASNRGKQEDSSWKNQEKLRAKQEVDDLLKVAKGKSSTSSSLSETSDELEKVKVDEFAKEKTGKKAKMNALSETSDELEKVKVDEFAKEKTGKKAKMNAFSETSDDLEKVKVDEFAKEKKEQKVQINEWREHYVKEILQHTATEEKFEAYIGLSDRKSNFSDGDTLEYEENVKKLEQLAELVHVGTEHFELLARKQKEKALNKNIRKAFVDQLPESIIKRQEKIMNLKKQIQEDRCRLERRKSKFKISPHALQHDSEMGLYGHLKWCSRQILKAESKRDWKLYHRLRRRLKEVIKRYEHLRDRHAILRLEKRLEKQRRLQKLEIQSHLHVSGHVTKPCEFSQDGSWSIKDHPHSHLIDKYLMRKTIKLEQNKEKEERKVNETESDDEDESSSANKNVSTLQYWLDNVEKKAEKETKTYKKEIKEEISSSLREVKRPPTEIASVQKNKTKEFTKEDLKLFTGDSLLKATVYKKKMSLPNWLPSEGPINAYRKIAYDAWISEQKKLKKLKLLISSNQISEPNSKKTFWPHFPLPKGKRWEPNR